MVNYQVLAQAYYKLLNHLDWQDEVLISGIREGLNKFLSNAYLKQHPSSCKYHKSQWVSPEALKQLNQGNHTDLVFEHMVPKKKYIQEPCEHLAASRRLTEEKIVELLETYWHIATITKQQDKLLSRSSMPDDWDGINVLSRYEIAGIQLVNNPYFTS